MRRRMVAAVATGAAVLVAAGVTIAVVLTTGGSGGPAQPPGRPSAGVTVSAAGDGRTAPPDGLTPAQRALADTLGPLKVHSCVPAPADQVTQPPGPGVGLGDGVDAAVLCQTNVSAGEPGPAEVLARHYRDAAAEQADAGRRAAAIDDVGSCAAGQPSTETWGRSTRQLGVFLCDRGPAGAFDIFWTVAADQTGLSAASTDAAGLIAWWRDFTRP